MTRSAKPGTRTRRAKTRRTTILDIAAAAGVSVTTVSRILNDKPDVADETRERVLRVMDELGFAPQSAWQQIRSGRSGTIALHFPQDFNPPAHRVLIAATLGCEDGGYSVNIVTRTLPAADLLAIFRSGRADAMILMEILTVDERARLLQEHGIPYVMVGRTSDIEGRCYVDVDIESGLDQALVHLFELGHRSVGFVEYAPEIGGLEYGFSHWARKGYEAASVRLGLEPIIRASTSNSGSMVDVARDLLLERPDITALVAPQETGIIGIVQAAQQLGIAVPADLSIVGLLSESRGELATPSLTAITFPADEMGAEAARILLGTMDGALDGPQQVLVRPDIVIRGSTGPAPVRSRTLAATPG